MLNLEQGQVRNIQTEYAVCINQIKFRLLACSEYWRNIGRILAYTCLRPIMEYIYTTMEKSPIKVVSKFFSIDAYIFISLINNCVEIFNISINKGEKLNILCMWTEYPVVPGVFYTVIILHLNDAKFVLSPTSFSSLKENKEMTALKTILSQMNNLQELALSFYLLALSPLAWCWQTADPAACAHPSLSPWTCRRAKDQ